MALLDDRGVVVAVNRAWELARADGSLGGARVGHDYPAFREGAEHVDINMPLMDGEEATRVIAREQPGVKVIARSLHSEDEMSAVMRDAGVVDYLSKSGPPSPLRDAIRAARPIEPVPR